MMNYVLGGPASAQTWAGGSQGGASRSNPPSILITHLHPAPGSSRLPAVTPLHQASSPEPSSAPGLRGRQTNSDMALPLRSSGLPTLKGWSPVRGLAWCLVFLILLRTR